MIKCNCSINTNTISGTHGKDCPCEYFNLIDKCNQLQAELTEQKDHFNRVTGALTATLELRTNEIKRLEKEARERQVCGICTNEITVLRDHVAKLQAEADEAKKENDRLKKREQQLVGVLQHIEIKCVDYDGYKTVVGLMRLIDTIKQIAETEESLSA